MAGPINPMFKYEQVYFVETSPNNFANPVAIRPEIYQSRIQWMDTSKGKVVELGQIDNLDQLTQNPPEVIEVTSERGEHYRLHKLTKDIYDNKVKSRVMLPPEFESDEEVQNFYLTSDFEIY